MSHHTRIVALTLSSAIAAPAFDRNVPGDYPTIHAAIDAADDNDSIFVGPGTYPETIDIGIKNLRLISTDGPYDTVIDALGGGSVLTIAGGQGAQTRIDGFTLTGGTGSTVGRSQRGQTFGGACYIAQSSSPIFANCIMHGNTATDGGALYLSDSSQPDFLNCLIDDNTASDEGGAVYCHGSLPSFFACTITENTAPVGSALYATNQSFPLINGSIVWGNDVVAASQSVAFWSYSNAPTPVEGGGNISADPRFLNPALRRYELKPGSPCIDAGDTFSLWPSATDLAGNPRTVDDPNTPDTGIAPENSPVADMGAFEYQDTPYSCTGDLNADGVVNVSDLLEVIVRWGQPYNVTDLLIVINNWGAPCGN